jgi:hypothetical protein
MDTITKVVDTLMEQYHDRQENNPYETHGLLFCSVMSFPLEDKKETGETVKVGTHIIEYYN